MFYSPLRYPGGKNRLSKFISQICVDNEINGHYVEPYAGGASVALHLLFNEKVSCVTINDYDRSIYAFWYSVLHYTDKLIKRIESTDITINEWEKQRLIQQNKKRENLLNLGFSTFFLNRTNISGILNAGPIGGRGQSGKYKLDCRFNKKKLISKIRAISEKKRSIQLYNLDAVDLIAKIKDESENSNTVFYFDPPYFIKGPGLYMNSYKKDDHKKIAEEIKKLKNINWIISYDNVPQIRELYSWVSRTKEFTLIHNASKPKKGKEILFFSSSLLIPSAKFIA